MELFIDGLIDGRIEIKEIDNERYSIKLFHNSKDFSNKASFSLDGKRTIILDKEGKDYILTFCCLKENRKVEDYFVSWSFIFKLNDEQVKQLKNLNGLIGIDKGFLEKKTNKSNALIKLENVLSSIGTSNEILKEMGIYSDIFHSNTYGFLNKIKKEGN